MASILSREARYSCASTQWNQSIALRQNHKNCAFSASPQAAEFRSLFYPAYSEMKVGDLDIRSLWCHIQAETVLALGRTGG